MLNLQHTQYATKFTSLQDFSFHIDYIDLLFLKAAMKKRNIVGFFYIFTLNSKFNMSILEEWMENSTTLKVQLNIKNKQVRYLQKNFWRF